MKYILNTVCLLGLYIMSSAVMAASETNYNLDTDARIRLYGQNGKPTILHSEIDCETNKKGNKTNVGGGLSDAFKSFIGTASNKSLGIPETVISKNLNQMNGILSNAFYKEVAVEAGKPVNVRGALIGTSFHTSNQVTYIQGCSSKMVSFTPQLGKDYEVLAELNGRQCSVVVKEIIQNHDEIISKNIEISKVFSCENKGTIANNDYS